VDANRGLLLIRFTILYRLNYMVYKFLLEEARTGERMKRRIFCYFRLSHSIMEIIADIIYYLIILDKGANSYE